jgi:hypothetical protein
MKEYWKQIGLLAAALAIGPFINLVSDVWIAAKDLRPLERILYDGLACVLAGGVLIALFLTLWWMFDKDAKGKNEEDQERNTRLDNIIASYKAGTEEEQRRNRRLDDLIASVNRLVERMEDGKID